MRGDANADGSIDLADAIRTLFGLFGGWPLECENAADSNRDRTVGISDAIYTLMALFLNGTVPAGPFPACGYDVLPEALPCGSFSACR